MADETTTTEEKKEMTAKTISKVFKFIATGGLVVSAVLKWAGILPNSNAGEICLIWAVVYGIGAGTIDANIIIDKYTGGKNWNTSAKYADLSIVAETKKSV
jgi:hypothetical protein